MSNGGDNEGPREERAPEANARDPVEALAEEYFEARRRGTAPAPGDFSARAGERSGELQQILEAASCLEDAADLLIPRESDLPPRLGRYRILRSIGRGGMGVVCEAVDEELGRHVALKILKSERAGDPADVERFQREARAAARLSHPHIVQVFGADSSDGRRFHVMQLVTGRSVSELLRAEGGADPRPAWLEPANVARLGLDVAEALAYAHAEGVLHRDVKPSNLLLDHSGCIWVADFGLAKLSEGDPVTRTGDVVGTPRYLAPEVLSSRSDHRTDVYGVGITLFEMLARRPAFTSNEPNAIFQQVLFSQPPRLRRLDPSIPVDLETIVHKCIEKEPSDRFAGARELAADLRRYLAGEPIVARRPTWSHRAWLFGRRHRAAVAIAMAAALLLVGLLSAWVVTLHAANLRELAHSGALSRANSDKDAALGDALRQRGRAEANLATATAAIDRFLARLGGDELAFDPKFQELRTTSLEDASRFLTEMLARGEDSTSVAGQTAQTLRRLAVVERMLGRSEVATTHAERAVALLRAAPDATAPPLPAAEVILASWVAGCVAQDRGDYERAERHLRHALSVPLPRSADVATRELLLSSRSQLAQLCQQGGDLAASRAEFKEVKRQCQEMAAEGHGGPEVRRNLRFAEFGLGDIARVEGSFDDARTHFEASIRVALELGSTDPYDRWRLNLSRFKLASVQAEAGDATAGAAEQKRVLDDQEALTDRYPTIPQMRLSLAWMHTFHGGRLKARKDRDGARRELKRALELHERLAVELPHEFIRLQNRIEAAITLGALEDDEGRSSEGGSRFTDAVRWADERPELLARYPDFADLRLLALTNLAIVESDPAAAIDAAREAIRTAEALQAGAAGRSFDRNRLDRARIELGYRLALEERFEEVEQVAQRILRDQPRMGGAPTSKAAAEALLGGVALSRDELDEAESHYGRAVELREQWAAARPFDLDNLIWLGENLSGLVKCARARGDSKRELELAERAVARRRDMVRADPGFWRAPRRLAAALTMLAEARIDHDEIDGAAKAAEEAGGLAPDDETTQLACARILAACSVAAAAGISGSAADAGRAERWAAAAIARLDAAVRAGFRDVKRCEETPEFDALVERVDYAALLESMRKSGQ